VLAHEPLERARGLSGRRVDPRAPVTRRRAEHGEDAHGMGSFRGPPECDHDEGCACAGGEHGRRAIGERGGPEEVDRDRWPLPLGHLVDEHRDTSAAGEGLLSRCEGALGSGELHSVRLARTSHERVEPAHRDGLHDDEQIEGPRHRARGELPVARVRRGEHGAATARERVIEEPSRPRVERAHIGERLGGPAREPEQLHHARAQRSIHPEGNGTRITRPCLRERRHDVGSPHAKHGPEEPREG
jgi:hypothetical protein